MHEDTCVEISSPATGQREDPASQPGARWPSRPPARTAAATRPRGPTVRKVSRTVRAGGMSTRGRRRRKGAEPWGSPETAKPAEIKTAYRKLARETAARTPTRATPRPRSASRSICGVLRAVRREAAQGVRRGALAVRRRLPGPDRDPDRPGGFGGFDLNDIFGEGRRRGRRAPNGPATLAQKAVIILDQRIDLIALEFASPAPA